MTLRRSLVTEMLAPSGLHFLNSQILAFWIGAMTNETPALPGFISVLLADSKPIESTLLAGSLRRQGFHVGICGCEAGEVMQFLEKGAWDVVVNTLPPAASGLPDT